MSTNSSSSTMVKGRCQHATQMASFIQNLCGVYVKPWANATMEDEPQVETPLHDLEWWTKLLVLSLWRMRVTFMEGDL